MRQIKYLSPTSISIYQKDPTEFYLSYMADYRPKRIPQTSPMAVGSAFDAFIKSHLHAAIFGPGNNPKFDRMAIFESQVEPQNRDGAYKAGEYLFNEYKKAGCLADIMLELQNSVTEPRFELEVHGVVDGYREGITKSIGPVTLLGKPDIFFTNKAAARVIFDWKVNGYYSDYNMSPMPGYLRIRESSGFKSGSHKDAIPQMWRGMMINVAHYLETLKVDWAAQLAIYTWLCGEEVGSDLCITAIDQLVCKKSTVRDVPDVRFAEHRLRVSKDFQFHVFAKAQEIWEIVQSDHFFRNLTKEESQARCEQLDKMFEPNPNATEEDKWFEQATRGS